MCFLERIQYNYLLNLFSQSDRLQTRIQERDLMASQSEIVHKSDIADRDETIAKLQSDLRVIEEKLANTQSQVCFIYLLNKLL